MSQKVEIKPPSKESFRIISRHAVAISALELIDERGSNDERFGDSRLNLLSLGEIMLLLFTVFNSFSSLARVLGTKKTTSHHPLGTRRRRYRILLQC
jgi:hypothetical protein